METNEYNIDLLSANYVEDARIPGVTIERCLGQIFVTVPDHAEAAYKAAMARAYTHHQKRWAARAARKASK